MLNQEGMNNHARPHRDREPQALDGLWKSKGPKAACTVSSSSWEGMWSARVKKQGQKVRLRREGPAAE